MLRSVGKQSGESMELVVKKKKKVTAMWRGNACQNVFAAEGSVPEYAGCYWCCSITPIQEIGPLPRTGKREKSSLFWGKGGEVEVEEVDIVWPDL